MTGTKNTDIISREKRIVEQMIRLYCRRKEGNRELCQKCKALLEYAHQRLDACKFGERKTSCRKCPLHCYKPEMRERIRAVMRYAGPRMLLYHPVSAIKHFLNG